MTYTPSIGEEEIQARVGKRGLQRGRDYFQDGAVFNARRQGPVLKASCSGSGRNPYQVKAVFGPHGLEDAVCSCPIGSGGRCKHVAAVLIGWLKAPERFVELEELDAVLQRTGREQLLDLIGMLIRAHPELEEEIESLLDPGRVDSTLGRVDTWRHEVAALLRRTSGDPRASAELGDRLRTIKRSGDQLRRRGQIADAAPIYLAIAGELLAHPDVFSPEQHDLVDVVGECVDGLGRCLKGIDPNSPLRIPILKALLEVYQQSLRGDFAALGRNVPNLILEHVGDSERRKVAGWVEELLPPNDDLDSRRALGGLLLELSAEFLDDEAFLELCRQTGRVFDLARRLIRLGRSDQIQGEAAAADDYELVRIADLLTRHRQAELAHALVRERLQSSPSEALQKWLAAHEAARGELEATLDLWRKLFRLRPGCDAYRQLRDLSRRGGTWDAVRPELLDFLQQTGRAALLFEIHLDEGQLDQALEVMHSATELPGQLKLELAAAAEPSRPREALEIYCSHVDQLISRRGRRNYARACRYLRKIRSLMTRAEGIRAWDHYVATLRTQHHALRAFLEELTAAGL